MTGIELIAKERQEQIEKHGHEKPDDVTLRAWGKSVNDKARYIMANFDLIANRSEKVFSPDKIDEFFHNVRKGKGYTPGEKYHYIIRTDKGDFAEISYFGVNEWRIFKDNFPGQKQFYQTNFPIRNIEDFITEMKRIGIDLKINP